MRTDIKTAPQQRKRKGVFLSCQTCGGEFYVPQARLRQAERQGVTVRYCAMKCYDKHGARGPFFGKTHSPDTLAALAAHPNRPRFLSGAGNPNVVRFGADYEHKTPEPLKQRLLAERGAACERCGYDEVPGVLETHHKDRNRRNNALPNLEVLCPTCHSVDHYRSRDGLYNRLKVAA